MLNELKNLKYPGRKEDILFLLRNIIGDRALLPHDLSVICSHAPAGYQLFYDALLTYCTSFTWITVGEVIAVNESLYKYLDSDDVLNNELIKRTVKALFETGIFKTDMFAYDVEECRITFHNEHLPLAYSAIRNVLISQGFLNVDRDNHRNTMYVNSTFEEIVSRFCKETVRTFTLEQLKAKIENNAIAGAKAEEFALNYERKRITNLELVAKIRIISNVDVSAGYDIISFEANQSTYFDRYIEVKAISRNGFFWSTNEYETAKLKGKQYYLYLIDLAKVNRADYTPIIINNPANEIMESDDWLVEAESYHIRKI
ncbi:MAG: DUF3883 domain-containing protein [Lachnospiraceae bacterium]|nr:DUF3883 domain-containing protein [Lachnospiraceae bacterium]